MVPKKSSTNFWTVPFVDSSRVKKISGMDLEQCVIRIVVIKVVIAKCHRNRHHDQGGGQDYVLVRAWHGGLYGGAQVVRSHQVVSLRGALLSNNDDDDDDDDDDGNDGDGDDDGDSMMESIMLMYQAREESKRRSSSTAWHRGKTRDGGWGEARPERNSMTAIMMIMILNMIYLLDSYVYLGDIWEGLG